MNKNGESVTYFVAEAYSKLTGISLGSEDFYLIFDYYGQGKINFVETDLCFNEFVW